LLAVLIAGKTTVNAVAFQVGGLHVTAEVAAVRLSHGLKETEAGITMKLKRRTFTAIFFLACIAAIELEQVVLEEI
jgi:Domain of unknown function (DUF6471)